MTDQPTEPDGVQPDRTRSDQTQPDRTQPDQAQPDSTEPVVVPPDATEPSPAQPGAAPSRGDFMDGGGAADTAASASAASASAAGASGVRGSHRRSGPIPPRRRDPLRTVIRGLGQLLITAGVVVLLFVVYEVWVTNLFGEQRQASAAAALDKEWGSTGAVVTSGQQVVVTSNGGTVVVTDPAQLTVDPQTRQPHYDLTEGAGFARMYVPAFGTDFQLTVIEGTSQDDLYAGPGHYSDTQLPGEKGNFALAGHRVNKGAPFDDLGLLKSCDAVIIETQSDWFVYRVLPMEGDVAGWATATHAHCDGVKVQTGQYAGVYGQEIVLPSDYAQVLPVPHVNSTAIPADAERMITLTTCNPKFSDRERMIIHGVLVKSYAKAAGFVPPELSES